MNTVLLAKKMNLTKEMYLAIMLDRASMGNPNPNPDRNPDRNPIPNLPWRRSSTTTTRRGSLK